MIATERPDLQLDTLGLGGGDPNRSPGLHLSTIIKSVMMVLEPDRFTGPLDVPRVETGCAFEDLLAESLARRIGWSKPGEFVKDGVIGSPDGLDADAWRVDEVKCTWVSDKDGLDHPKLSHWMLQVKGYCHMLATTQARMYVLFVNGDYKPPRPVLRVWDLTFTDRELADNWTMLLTHARKREMWHGT